MSKRAFVFKDEKSSKFWWIENQDNEFVVNFGKEETNGRYQIKEFASSEECDRETYKLITQKIKKGYIENSTYDFINHSYFDDEEYGLNPMTSHPYFREHFSHKLYYDCGDEETPFGSDAGNDALYEMQNIVRQKKNVNLSSFPKFLIEDIWEMIYIEPSDNRDIIKSLLDKDDMNFCQSMMITASAAFGQIKITGYVNKDLKENALTALRGMDILAWEKEWQPENRHSEITNILIKDLSSFNKYK